MAYFCSGMKLWPPENFDISPPPLRPNEWRSTGGLS